MSGEEVARKRIALNNEIDRIAALVKAFKFQEAEESFTQVDELYRQLVTVINEKSEIHRRIIQNSKIKIDILSQNIADGLERRDIGKKQDGNIAFKCNWNDKNYQGVCSDSAYSHNQIYGGPWCLYSRCRQFVNLPVPPNDCCYEARALIDCSFGAGWDHDEYGNGIRPRKITSAREGKIALLTTKPPYTNKRLLIGAFLIEKVREDPDVETFIIGDKATKIDDMLQYEIEFWKYHKNPNKPDSTTWATLLFRYVSDVTVLGILEEYIDKKRKESKDTSEAERLVETLINSTNDQFRSR